MKIALTALFIVVSVIVMAVQYEQEPPKPKPTAEQIMVRKFLNGEMV